MDIDKVANGLGWFSIGLGVSQLLAPNKLGHMIGVGEHPTMMRTMGVREIATGIGVLAQDRPKAGMWSRVAGDVLDLTFLAKAMTNKSSGSNARTIAAAGAVLGVGLMDYLCAREM